jgi:hypothetical protein
MTHPEKSIWVRQVFPKYAHRGSVNTLTLAFLILLAGLLTASPALAETHHTPMLPEIGVTALDPGVSEGALSSLKGSAFPKSGPAAAFSNQPTRTPRPTSTPPAIPPPASPTSTSIMILLATLVMAIILAGLWINRRRAF